MKSMNLFSRFFIGFAVWTLVFLSLAAYAMEKTYETDPELIQKLGEKYQVSFSLSENSWDSGKTSSTFLEAAKESWHLALPEKYIVLKSRSGNLTVRTTTEKQIVLSATGKSDKSKTPHLLEIDSDNSKLTIKQPDEDRIENLEVLLLIPESYAQNLEINKVNGELNLEKLKLKSLDLNVVASDVNLKQIQSDSLDAKIVSGNIKAVNSSFSKLHGKSVSGDLEFDNATSSNTDLMSVSGNISLKLATAANTDFTLRSLSGNINNKYDSASNAIYKIKLFTTSGDLKIE